MPHDYHVVSLTYSVTSGDGVTYDAPPSVEFERDKAHFRLADGILTCRMKVYFSTPAEARSAVDPILLAWEIEADLGQGHRGLHFNYTDAEVVDRTPVPPGIAGAQIYATDSADTMNATVTMLRHAYPAPPGHFRITPDVETLWRRYQGYFQGREPLLAMANFCLSAIEFSAGGRRQAVAKFNISKPVLDKLGVLASERGDQGTARKLKKSTRPLSGAEEAWIQAAIKQLILRAGDQRSVVNLPTITMAELPPL